MSDPSLLKSVQVTQAYQTPGGTPASGSVTFTASQFGVATSSGRKLVKPDPVTATLDGAGLMTATLIAPCSYQVREAIGTSVNEYYIEVPSTATNPTELRRLNNRTLGARAVAAVSAAKAVTWNGSAWSMTKAEADTAHSSGYALIWIGTTQPTAAQGWSASDYFSGAPVVVTPPAPTTVSVTTAPVAVDGSGTANDSVTLTKVTGVTYTVNGSTYPSSSFTGSTMSVPYTGGTNTTVTATAESGYVLSGTTSWPLTFTNVVAPTSVSVTTAPVAVDTDGTGSDTITLTKVTGVTYTVNGIDHTSSSFTGSTKVVPYAGGVNTTVTAKAESGYTLTGTTSWPLTFTNVTPPTSVSVTTAPVAVDGAGTANDSVTLTKVTGVTYTVNGVDHTSSSFTGSTKSVPYTGGANTTVTAKAESGYTLTGTTSWNLTFTGSGSATTVNWSGTAWSMTPTQVTTARNGGNTIYWDGPVPPTTADGALDGDFYVGTVTSGASTNIPLKIVNTGAAQYPVATDGQGTGDTIKLTRLTGVIWTVDGVDHDYASFAGASTKTVNYTGGVDTTVTARADVGYEMIAGAVTSWPLTFTNVTTPSGVLTSSDFSNYANGTTFTEASGSGVALTMNNALGGTQTTASAKYCNINSGNLVIQSASSFFYTQVPNLPTAGVTLEFTYRANATGDCFIFPVYGSGGNGFGARITAGGILGGGKSVSWTLSGPSLTTGAAKQLVAGDVVKLVWDGNTTVTAFVNDVQQWTYVQAKPTNTATVQFINAATANTSCTIDNVKVSVN